MRGDYGKIVIGNGSNIQENCTLHSEPDTIAILEENVLIGHAAVVHLSLIHILEHNAGIKIAQVNVNVKGVKVLGGK